MKIPTICILIPGSQGKHSKCLFYPRYVLDMFKRLWDPMMQSPDDLVRKINFPAGTTKKFKFRNVTSMAEEKAFWANYFNGAQKGLFDTAMPGRTFEQEFELLLKDMAKQGVAPEPKEVEVAIPEEIAEMGLEKALAIALVMSGYKDRHSIAEASLAELMEVEGMEAPLADQIRNYAIQQNEPVVVAEDV